MELHLANLAETRERVRRRRTYERAEGPPQRESLAEAADRLAGRSSKAAARALDDLRLDLTLTAHPTEATRWSVMEHAGDVSARLAELDDERLGPAARHAWSTASASRSPCGGRPPRSGAQRPQVDDEVRRNLHFFDNVLFDAVPELVRELERCFGPQPLDFAPVRFSSWAGGDMDGHPGVTAATFTTTVDLHRRVAMRLMIDRVERLASRSSQSADEMGAGRAALESSLRRDASLMPEVTRRLGERRRHEPVRAKLNYVSERLRMSGEEPDSPLAYRDAGQLRRDRRARARRRRRRAGRRRRGQGRAAPGERLRPAPGAARRAAQRRRDQRLGAARRAAPRPRRRRPSAAASSAPASPPPSPTASGRPASRPRRCTPSAPPPAATAPRPPTRS